MTKSTKQTNTKPKAKRNFNGIIGLLQLFVVASIGYTTTVIALGTEGYVPLALSVPQVAWAVVILVKRFTN